MGVPRDGYRPVAEGDDTQGGGGRHSLRGEGFAVKWKELEESGRGGKDGGEKRRLGREEEEGRDGGDTCGMTRRVPCVGESCEGDGVTGELGDLPLAAIHHMSDSIECGDEGSVSPP